MSQLPNSSESLNPYAAPISGVGYPSGTTSDAERIRKDHIRHEASIKSIGTLYLLGAFILIAVACFLYVAMIGTSIADRSSVALSAFLLGAGLATIYLGLGLLQGMTAFGLFKLKPWARIVAIVLNVIGLIGFPIGTLISAYFLYLLLSRKGVYIFSEEYQAIVAQTPHVKYKTSKIVWFFLIILILLISVAVMAAIFS
jgi:hypothetical protein